MNDTGGGTNTVDLPSTASETTAVNAGTSTTTVGVNGTTYVTTGTGFTVYDGHSLGTIAITFQTSGVQTLTFKGDDTASNANSSLTLTDAGETLTPTAADAGQLLARPRTS